MLMLSNIVLQQEVPRQIEVMKLLLALGYWQNSRSEIEMIFYIQSKVNKMHDILVNEITICFDLSSFNIISQIIFILQKGQSEQCMSKYFFTPK